MPILRSAGHSLADRPGHPSDHRPGDVSPVIT
jgi:hypothetical protein